MNVDFVKTMKTAEKPFSLFFFLLVKKGFFALVFGLLCLVFVFPVLKLVFLSFFAEGAITFQYYAVVLQEAATWAAVKNTVLVTASATALSVFIGTLLAWIVANCNVKGKKWITLMVFLPFIIPSYITTLAWVQFFRADGLAAALVSIFPFSVSMPNLYSVGGIVFLLGLSHYPLVFMMTVSLFQTIPRELEEAARTSGASRKTIFWKITLPLVLPGVSSGALLAFLSSLDNFGIPAFLGIPANIQVLSTYIYQQIVGFGPAAFAKAAVLSVLLGFLAFLATAFQWLLTQKKLAVEQVKPSSKSRIQLADNQRILLQTAVWLFLLVTGLVPLVSMAASSFIKAYGLPFAPENLSLHHYAYLLFSDAKAMPALWNSIKLAIVTTAFCLLAGTVIAYVRYRKPTPAARAAEWMVTVPYALPGTVLGLAMILTWMEPVPGWNPGLYGSAGILIIAYMTRFLILQVRGSYTSLSQLDPAMEDAARIFGARLIPRWKQILLPLILPGLVSGALFVFLTALTELTVSSLLWSAGTETVGVVVFNFEQAGYSRYSTAFSSLIVLAILAGGCLYVASERIWKRSVLKQRD